jgi:uncharacterized protein HemX
MMALNVDQIVEGMELLIRRFRLMRLRIAELERELETETARADALQVTVDRLRTDDRTAAEALRSEINAVLEVALRRRSRECRPTL